MVTCLMIPKAVESLRGVVITIVVTIVVVLLVLICESRDSLDVFSFASLVVEQCNDDGREDCYVSTIR